MSKAIRVENLSKAYQLGEIGSGTLSRDIEHWFLGLFKKKDSDRIGSNSKVEPSLKSNEVLSLKSLTFDIDRGDAVGIIGRNGSGKSTLLKVLSRVTSPTTGKIKIKGRIASLLEVGTGFHPDLTGRENIFLNGAILGMRKREILHQFDEIVDFSGIGQYIDTPVKRYSSGMYVRLAFAVAAHLQSEILIVDEVLAVGDAEFQKKCLGKMGEVSRGEGRTVLFVSHDMHAIARLANKCIWIDKGSIHSIGGKEVISSYISSTIQFSAPDYFAISKAPETPYIKSVVIHTSSFNHSHICGEQFKVELVYSLPIDVRKVCITVRIKDNRNVNCLDFSFFDTGEKYSCTGDYAINWIFPSLNLFMGLYTCDIFFAEPPGGRFFETLVDACSFSVTMFDQSRGEWEWKPYDTIYLERHKVNVSKI